jgi:hypothetical protein
VDRVVEIRLLDLATRVELAAFDDATFYDAMQRARDRGLFAAPMVVSSVLDCVTGVAGIVSAALVVAVLQARHVHPPRRRAPGADRGQRRDPPRRGGRPGGRERLG